MGNIGEHYMYINMLINHMYLSFIKKRWVQLNIKVCG